MRLGPSWGCLGAILGPSLGRLGDILGLSGLLLGSPGLPLGPSWGFDAMWIRLGCDLGRPEAVLGPSLGDLGDILSPSWAPSWAPLGRLWGLIGVSCGPFGVGLGFLSRENEIQ